MNALMLMPCFTKNLRATAYLKSDGGSKTDDRFLVYLSNVKAAKVLVSCPQDRGEI